MNIKPNLYSLRGRSSTLLNPGPIKMLRALSLKQAQLSPRYYPSICTSLDLDSRSSGFKRLNSFNELGPDTNEPLTPLRLNPQKVLEEFSDQLSEFEQKEILQYPEVYYISNSKKKHNGKFSDEKGYYRAFVGDQIAYRYEIMHLLGDGSFGIVVNCFDHKNQIPVAIKVYRKGKEFDENAELEVKNLNTVLHNEINDIIIQKLTEFKFRGHFCIVVELLSIDLFSYLKKNQFRGLSDSVLRRIAIQLIIGLKHIHQSGLIHCDLKPENILFKAKNKSGIKIIDFGSACEKGNTIFTYIQSRYYRAPEVILQHGYDAKIDMWSLGCILYELHTGFPLFVGEDELDQLCKIVEVLGDFPEPLVTKTPRDREIFDSKGKMISLEMQGLKPGSKRLSGLLKNSDSRFIDFLRECLRLDPEKRIDSERALMHPWVRGNKLEVIRKPRKYQKSPYRV